MSATLRRSEGVRKENASRTRTSKVGVALWTVQVLLALLFLFAGTMKFVMPVAEMTKQIPLPGLFLHFIGACEVSGAFGLILPSLLRIRPQLTPLAAAGLVIIMTGATIITAAIGPVAPAAMPLVVGLLAGFVCYGRTRIAPIAERRRNVTRRSESKEAIRQVA
jgi:uncharacterized membrane protein YphA (DoxX/SURF4 family)